MGGEGDFDGVKENVRVRSSISGITAWLHRKGFSYKRPKRLPGKAEAALQDAFLAQYRNLKENKKICDAIYFVDAAHPQHNPTLTAHGVMPNDCRICALADGSLGAIE